jgi:hypothetical protein
MIVPYRFFLHRAIAAFLAMVDLRFGDRRAALALPPLRPPNLPRATAAGFFSRGFSGSVASCTIAAAKALGSDDILERLCIPVM